MARNKYDVDETLDIELDFSHMKRLASYIKPYRKDLIITILIMTITSALSMLTPIIFKHIMDVYIPDGNIRYIVSVSAVLLGVFLIISAAQRMRITLTTRIGQNIIHEIRSDIFTHHQKLPFSYYDDRPHGKIQVRVVNYVNNLSDLLSNGIVNTITDLFSLIFIVIFMLSLDFRLGLICLAGLPVLMVLIFAVKKKQRRAWQLQSNKSSNLNAYIAENVNGIRVTQSFTREEENLEIFNELSNEYRGSWMSAVRLSHMLWPAINNISTWTLAAV